MKRRHLLQAILASGIAPFVGRSIARTVLAGNTTFYIDPVSGNDGNDGSQAHPWRSIQYAVSYLVAELDIARRDVTIQLANGTYSESVTVATQPLGHHVFKLRGNPGNPGAVLWARSDTAPLLSATDFGAVVVDGIEFGYYGNGGNCVQAFQFGIVDVMNCLFASCQGGIHLKAANQGSINIVGPYAIDGNAANHVQCDHAHVHLGAEIVSMNNHQTIGTFISVSNGGYVAVGGNPYNGIGAGGGTYGKQFDVQSNSVLRLNGVTLPGNVAGTSGTGGMTV